MPGEISDAVEPYVKEDRGNREKLCQSALEYCERLGNQRMPFAWAALYLTNVFRGANTLDSVSSGMEEESSDVDGQGTLGRSGLKFFILPFILINGNLLEPFHSYTFYKSILML